MPAEVPTTPPHQPPITPASPPKPTIFLLSLTHAPFFDQRHAPLIAALANKATLKRATKRAPALNFFSSTTPHAIFITDSALVKRAHAAVLAQVVAYVRAGGIAVLGAMFSSSVRPPDLDAFFRTHWSLPWQSGDYHRTTVALNTAARGVGQEQEQEQQQQQLSGLAPEYSQKAVFLKNVAPDAAWHLPAEESRVESAVFAPVPVDVGQAPVAFAGVGRGWLGYVGDVNAEKGSEAVVLAMCGLTG